jgi:hypothetical protein
VAEGRGEGDDGDLSLEVGPDGCLTAAERFRQPVGSNADGGLVVGEELAEPGDVADATVGVVGAGKQLLGVAHA